MSFDTELIAEQAREIEKLKQEIAFYETAKLEITGMLCSIGAPLNDNKLQYSKNQIVLFLRIAKSLDIF